MLGALMPGRRTLASCALACAACALALIVSGCGGGGSGGDKPADDHTCTKDQLAWHCTTCLNGRCLACKSPYTLENASATCVAGCVVHPVEPSSLPAPTFATEHNGKAWPEMCINKSAAHFFGVGDWGGIGSPPKTFDNIGGRRPRVNEIDGDAQVLVAKQMNLVSVTSDPDYVLNVGDNFYPGGYNVRCGGETSATDRSGQFRSVYENVYNSQGLHGKPWLGCFGNHDYGGIRFDNGWDHQIYYSWTPNGRWRTPAQYWSQRVQYRDFAVDYFFLESNFMDAKKRGKDPNHNICQYGDMCPNGLTNISCPGWFSNAWQGSLQMLEKGMKESTAEWQIVVTHFPGNPVSHDPGFQKIDQEYGIDLLLTGHTHLQQTGNGPTGVPFIVSGGGGGITSDALPTVDGNDDAYGFVDFTISRTSLTYEMISHGGVDGKHIVRSTHTIQPRPGPQAQVAQKSAQQKELVV